MDVSRFNFTLPMMGCLPGPNLYDANAHRFVRTAARESLLARAHPKLAEGSRFDRVHLKHQRNAA